MLWEFWCDFFRKKWSVYRRNWACLKSDIGTNVYERDFRWNFDSYQFNKEAFNIEMARRKAWAFWIDPQAHFILNHRNSNWTHY